MGEIVAGDMEAYRYLVESIRKFPNQADFKSMFQVTRQQLRYHWLIIAQKAGFQACTVENLSFGIAAIHSGFRFK